MGIMIQWIVKIFSSVPSLANMFEKWLDYKKDMLPLEIEKRTEKKQITRVVNKKIEKKKEKRLIKAHLDLTQFEDKVGFHVVKDKEDLVVLEKLVEDELPEKEKKRYRKRRKRIKKKLNEKNI